MTRKQAILALLSVPLARYSTEAAQSSAVITEGHSLKFEPLWFHMSNLGVAGLTISNGEKEIKITFDEIWAALSDGK